MTNDTPDKSYLSQSLENLDFHRFLLMELIDLVKSAQIEEIAKKFVTKSDDDPTS
jgi:hypothetical protein